MFISLKVSVKDVRLSGVYWSKICIHRKKYACMIKFQLQCSSIFTGYRTISSESFPFLLEIFFVKECIKEITRFVAAVKNFPWEINSLNTTELHAHCTLRRVRNRFSTANLPVELRKHHAHQKKYLMRLLISLFDATIRVKRAPASRGFASHVFLVYSILYFTIHMSFIYHIAYVSNMNMLYEIQHVQGCKTDLHCKTPSLPSHFPCFEDLKVSLVIFC